MKQSLSRALALLVSFFIAQSGYAAQKILLTPTGDAADVPQVAAPKAKRKFTAGGLSCAGRAALHQESITKYAEKYGVDASVVKAVIAIESCYNSGAVSPAGAQGLMQLIPATASRFGVSDTFNSAQNINGGTRYLSWLMKRYDGDLTKTLAAYNAGEGAVDKYQGIPPYDETQHYVRNVLTVYNRLSGDRVGLPAVTAVRTSGRVAPHASGRVSMTYDSPLANPTKPGRGGWRLNKALAPQLFKH